jgi:hypothetical protein
MKLQNINNNVSKPPPLPDQPPDFCPELAQQKAPASPFICRGFR